MTTVLFAHDGYVSIANGDIYSDTYDNKIVDRYFNIAENVVFLVRTRDYSDNNNKQNKITRENFRVEGIKNFKSLKGIFEYQRITGKIEQEVRKADYVVARIPSDLGFLVAKYAKKYNKRYMIEVVGCPWDSLRNHSTIGKMIAPYYYLKQKETLKHAPYALYVTKEFLQTRYPCEGKSIGCSDVEIREHTQDVLTRRIEKIKQANMRSLVFGTLGTLHMKYKGFDTVIKALAAINKEGYSHRYFIAGAGDPSWLNSVIQKYHAEEFVKIVPPMPHDEVFKWLDEIDIYIQPSKTEGMPRALIEAMSRACPSIGSCVGGIPELINKGMLFRKESKELQTIIKGLRLETITANANFNFHKSNEFLKDVLFERREQFYKLLK